ncbi:MAG: hypothetical protein HYR56_05670 [Acidobacteria bacterium]|nr:hypothetical protein [Acidobacteriota bacterium]MBI3421772.1 hypothetical protein [Acidobacteriota bacterium]
MKYLQESALWLFICFAAIGLGAMVFQMVVLVPVVAHDLPGSVLAFNQNGIKPAVFWTSPLLAANFLLGLLATALHWRTTRRYWVLAAIGLAVLAEIFTVVYCLPRLSMMGFLLTGNALLSDGAQLTRVAHEWMRADVLRFWALIVPAFLCALKALSIPLQRLGEAHR